MKTYTRKAGLIGVSSIMLLAGALPAAAADPASASQAQPAVTMPAPDLPVKEPGVQPSEEPPADTKISRDEAIALARKAVKIPDDFTLDNISYYSSGMGIPGSYGSWHINFVKREGERYFGNIGVGIHADTGKLLQFNRYYRDPGERPSYPPKTGLKEAKELAAGFLQSMYPAEAKETRYNPSYENQFKTPLNGDVRYQFRYDRLVNGIPFPQNGFTVEVDGDGRVVGFQVNWESGLKFEDKAGVITKEKALEQWKKESRLVPAYFKHYDANKRQLPLAVTYQFQAVTLDAVTGKAWPEGSQTVIGQQPLTGAPLGEAPKAGATLTRDQAVAAVTSKFTLPAHAKLENASYNEYAEPVPYSGVYGSKKMEGTWNINWSVQEPADSKDSKDSKDQKVLPPNSSYIYATVNATTGEVTHFNIGRGYSPADTAAKDEKEYKVSFEEAKSASEALVKKLAPHMTHQLIPVYSDPANIPEASRKGIYAYPFTFMRYIDGVQAGGESVQVTIDRKTGLVSNYYNSLSTEAYPESKPEMLSPDKALELWSGQYDLELQYTAQVSGDVIPYDIPIEKYNVLVASGEIPYSPTADRTYKLVYVPVAKVQEFYNIYLDAVTGEWRNSGNGEKAVLGKVEASDTAGHWAGRELDLMVEYQALKLEDGKVNPDRIATRGEMIKMLLTAMNGGYFYASYDSARAASFADVKASSEYFAYVENAVDRNLIDRNPDGNFNPEAPMTRDEMAELIVRALGYNALAKVPGLFRLDVSDAGEVSRPGHAALVLSLGIMSASDGKFLPKAEVTRAQAAVAFFRYLEKRGTLLDQPQYMY